MECFFVVVVVVVLLVSELPEPVPDMPALLSLEPLPLDDGLCVVDGDEEVPLDPVPELELESEVPDPPMLPEPVAPVPVPLWLEPVLRSSEPVEPELDEVLPEPDEELLVALESFEPLLLPIEPYAGFVPVEPEVEPEPIEPEPVPIEQAPVEVEPLIPESLAPERAEPAVSRSLFEPEVLVPEVSWDVPVPSEPEVVSRVVLSVLLVDDESCVLLLGAFWACAWPARSASAAATPKPQPNFFMWFPLRVRSGRPRPPLP